MNEQRLQQLRDEYKNEIPTKLFDAIVNLIEALMPDTKTEHTDELWTTSQVSDAVLFAWQETSESCTQRELIDAVVYNLRDQADTKTGTDSSQTDRKTTTFSGQEWPPSGVAIEVSRDGKVWVKRISADGGNYYSPEGPVSHLGTWRQWRYAPAPWQNVSEDMVQWAVFSDGTTDWSNDADYWHVGDNNSGFATCIHVENRPEDV